MSQYRLIEFNYLIESTAIQKIVNSIFNPCLLSGGEFFVDSTNDHNLAISPVTLIAQNGLIIQESSTRNLAIPAITSDYTITLLYNNPGFGGISATLTKEAGLTNSVTNGTVLGWVRYPGNNIPLAQEMLYQPQYKRIANTDDYRNFHFLSVNPWKRWFFGQTVDTNFSTNGFYQELSSTNSSSVSHYVPILQPVKSVIIELRTLGNASLDLHFISGNSSADLHDLNLYHFDSLPLFQTFLVPILPVIQVPLTALFLPSNSTRSFATNSVIFSNIDLITGDYIDLNGETIEPNVHWSQGLSVFESAQNFANAVNYRFTNSAYSGIYQKISAQSNLNYVSLHARGRLFEEYDLQIQGPHYPVSWYALSNDFTLSDPYVANICVTSGYSFVTLLNGSIVMPTSDYLITTNSILLPPWNHNTNEYLLQYIQESIVNTPRKACLFRLDFHGLTTSDTIQIRKFGYSTYNLPILL